MVPSLKMSNSSEKCYKGTIRSLQIPEKAEKNRKKKDFG